MSLFPVPNPTWADMLNAQIQTFAQDPLFRAAAKSWAAYTLQLYSPRFGATFDSPYVDWNEDVDGKRPRCQPVGRIIVDTIAEFLFSETPRVTCPKNTEVETLITNLCDQNAIDAKLLPLARQAGNEGGAWLKFAWTPENTERPIAINFLSPWEVKAYRDPLDADTLTKVRIRLKFQDDADGKWYLYQEVWTPKQYTVYERLETSEHDDSLALRGFQKGEWPIAKTEVNRFGMIPLVQVFNRRLGSETDGVGDLWDLYDLIHDISHTYWLMNRSNQWDGDPITVFINCDTTPNQLLPGEVSKIKGKDADVKRLVPENNLREHMRNFVTDVERLIMDAAGCDRLNPDAITNKGNLTRQVLELIFHRSVKTTLEKRKNWGKFGLAQFFQKMLLALSRLEDARRMFPVLKTINPKKPETYQIVIGWPSMFKITPDERTAIISDLISCIEADLISWERAVEIAADVWGITDLQALKAELETQKADKQAAAENQMKLEADLKNPTDDKEPDNGKQNE